MALTELDSRDIHDAVLFVCDLHDIGVFTRDERIDLVTALECGEVESAPLVVAAASFMVNHRYKDVAEGDRVRYIRKAAAIQAERLRVNYGGTSAD